MAEVPHMNLTEWRDRMAALADACAISEAGEGAALVRVLSDLLRREPGSAARDLPLGGAPLEALLAAGGEAAAALALVEERAGYMLSSGQGGSHLATVVLADSGRETSAGGASAALVLVGAFAAALSQAAASGVASAAPGSLSSPSLRLN